MAYYDGQINKQNFIQIWEHGCHALDDLKLNDPYKII